MDPEFSSEAGHSVPPSRPEGPSHNDTGTAAPRRPVRRDPEKRRQQNLQAQKRYSKYSTYFFSSMLDGTTASGLVHH